MSRSTFNWLFGALAAIAAVVSLFLAFPEGDNNADIGKYIVGAWVLLPPVFFWLDWVFMCRGLSKVELDIAKHTHDLSRNIWLGLVVVLAVGFGLTGQYV